MNGRLKRRASSPGWQQRMRDLVLAGGALGVVGCATDGHGTNRVLGGPEAGFCGNANPDPCICGRPEASAAGAEQCAAKTACDRRGGTYDYAPDGQVVCTPPPPGTTSTSTSTAPSSNPPGQTPSSLPDGGFGFFCGNANPDPCICGRPKLSEAFAKACDEWKVCTDHGGMWDLEVDPPRYVCVGFDASLIVPPDASL